MATKGDRYQERVYNLTVMRWVWMCLLALLLVPGCKSRKRYDGTCKVDADCLEFQKCASDVCVRAKPIFKPYEPAAAVPTPAPLKKAAAPKAPVPASTPEEPAATPVGPVPKPGGLGPAVPRQRDPQLGRKFRLDA